MAFLTAVKGFSGEGLPIFVYAQWSTLTNTAIFHELHSTTNFPPEARNYILTVLGSMGVQASDRKRIAEPGEAINAGSRLVWAATDGTNYVVHYEFLWTPDSHRYLTNYCITAALHDPTDGKLKCGNGGYKRRFKDYRDFIDYENHVLVRF